MPIDLRNKPIAITGAGTGIGAATAIACARAGMPVAICGRRADRLNQVAAEIRKLGGKVLVMPLDVADAAASRAFIERTVQEFGSIYSVYANAGFGLEIPIHRMSEQDLRQIFEVNFWGSLNVIRPALDHMLKSRDQHKGHVLWCSSCLAKMTLPYYGAYSATKAAQNHLGRAMRLELEPLGVHVSTVHPITTRTELFDKVKDRSGLSDIEAHAPAFFTQDAETVADHTINCLRRPRAEVWTGFKGAIVRLGMSVNTFFPAMADLATRGMVKRKMAKGI
jgi:short-subunit dehydrogenase